MARRFDPARKSSRPVAMTALALAAAWLAVAGARQSQSQPAPEKPAQTAEKPAGTPADKPAELPAAPAPPTKPLVPVVASTLAAKPDAYYGEFVSMTATVDQRFSRTAFTMDQDAAKTLEQDVIVVAPRILDDVEANTYVTVIGEVVRFDPAYFEGRFKDFKLDLAPDVVEKYRGRPLVVASSVINSKLRDLTMRLPPPMTAEEEQLADIMKKIQPALGTVRKAIEGSSADTAQGPIATLKQAFADVEVFWRARKGSSDAVRWAQDGKRAIDAAERGIAAGKWEDVKTAAGELGKTCQGCHGVYRERFDDGSFRIKKKAD
jgi:cytochrome c556